MQEGNLTTQLLLDELTERKNIYVIPATMQGRLVIRFVVCNAKATREDISFAWTEIQAALKSVKNKECKKDKTDRSQLERIIMKDLQQLDALRIKRDM